MRSDARQMIRRETTSLYDLEARAHSLRTFVRNMNERSYWQLSYDIPERLSRECPNPSGWLWKYGYRATLSQWVLPENSLHSPRVREEMNLWKRHNVRVRLVKYAADQLALIRQEAQEALEQMLREAHTSLIENIDAADQKLARMLDYGPCPPSVESGRDNRVRSILRDAIENLKQALACAELYDQSEQFEDLFTGLSAAIRSQARTFNARMIQEGKKDSLQVRI